MSGRKWTDEEIKKLEYLCENYTFTSIARIMGRSVASVMIKANRLGINSFRNGTDMLTMNKVCEILAIDHKTIEQKWIPKGLRFKNKGKLHMIRQESLLEYMKNHPEDWNAANITNDTIFVGCSWFEQKKQADKPKTYFWNEYDAARMRSLRYHGYTVPEIARIMGRSEGSIKYKLYTERRNKQYGTYGRTEQRRSHGDKVFHIV